MISTLYPGEFATGVATEWSLLFFAHVLLIQSIIKKETAMQSIKVKGMSCEHCREAVSRAIKSVPGVSSVVVDLKNGEARWTEADKLDINQIKDAVRRVGFETA